MKWVWMCLIAVWLNGAPVSITAAPIASSGTAIFPIDPQNRASDIINLFNALNTNSPFNNPNSEFGIQTRTGWIRQVRTIIPAANSTILIVGSQVSRAVQQLAYYVVFVEQIVEAVYYQLSAIPNSPPFTTHATTGVLSVFPIDLSDRAADLIDVFTKLKTNAIGNPLWSAGTVAIGFQTTASGPFSTSLVPTNMMGISTVPFVQCVSYSPNYNCASSSPTGYFGTLLFITYNYNNSSPVTNSSYIILAPDQITGISYSP